MNEGPSDTLDLDVAGLADWNIRLAGDAWILAGADHALDLAGPAGARVRVARQGITHLLVGANGHPSVLSAISAARGGETILVAPGVYREDHAFVIDRAVTLQGVSRTGTPIQDGSDAESTIVVPPAAAGHDFTIAAPGVVIRGLAFVTSDQRSIAAPRPDTTTQVQLFNSAGQLQSRHERVQTALDAARDGDRITVPAGRHVGDLHISKAVTLVGMNAGRPGHSRRGVESMLLGCIVMSPSARTVVIDGLVLLGPFVMRHAAAADRSFALRNCIIDGRDGETAISLTRGCTSEIFNNLILGGGAEAIFIRRGFDDLCIGGNRFQAAAGAAGIALCGGPGPNRIQIVGNTFLDGDYGILIEEESGLGQPGDAVVVSGNHFGEDWGGIAGRAPAVAAIHADGPFPRWLEFSMSASLDLNSYHLAPSARSAT